MQTNFVVLLMALTATVMASPTALEASELVESAACHHPSSCGRFWSGKCEDYCDYRGFSHMSSSGCSWLAKKCCCKKA
ncbi:uncharacterized protein N7529_012011 [Penicillium soppii]|uniref:uncharacterized protein n=1 Tax=Penicillium soppii TaxID=69789 RepID=UPI0025497614|nr:uncharacterized protein N7529_012011 [Penicillium soppii]KAJ5852626.1 hypothetical protein N7529_012011 [Penicillium soppii]